MAIKHVKQSGLPADGGDPSVVNPSDWYAGHTIDNNTITTAMLATTAVTPGTYINTTLTVGVDGRITAASSGGGGITNSAGSNVIMKSDGTNAVASRLTDNGTILAYPGLWNLDQTVTNAYSIGEILRGTLAYAPGTPLATGSTGDTCMVVMRNHTAYDTTAGGNAALGAYFEVTPTKTAGSNALVAKAIELLASGADQNYAIHVTGGDILHDTSGGLYVTAGPSQLTGDVLLGAPSTGTPHDVTVQHNLAVTNQVNITGPGSTLYAIQVTKGIISAGDVNGASGFGVLRANGQNGQDALQIGCPNDGGSHAKFWSMYMSGQNLRLFEYNQTANGSGGTATSGNDRITFHNGGGVEFLGCIATGTESLTTSGAASVALGNTWVTGAATALTLADGTMDGQTKTVTATSGTGQVTPAHFGNGTKMTWSGAGQSCTFTWNAANTKWWLTANVGMTVV